jgi:type IV pilus assembly protein PilM
VRDAFSSASKRLHVEDLDVALLLPDPVIRVFVQHFEEFPRSSLDAVPMLRWKLKKSVPFAIEETLISYMRQAPRHDGVDIIAALARQRIVAEYDAAAESVKLRAGVILSSFLAALALLDGREPVLMVRVSGEALTAAIVRDGVLCGYRCTELPAGREHLTPKMLLDEIFPVAAYYQDTWKEGIQSIFLAGLGHRLSEFVGPLEDEFHCQAQSLLRSALSKGLIASTAAPLVDYELEGLAGLMRNHSKDFGGIL